MDVYFPFENFSWFKMKVNKKYQMKVEVYTQILRNLKSSSAVNFSCHFSKRRSALRSQNCTPIFTSYTVMVKRELILQISKLSKTCLDLTRVIFLWTTVLILAGVQLIVLLVAALLVCCGFRVRIKLVMYWCFNCCWEELTQVKDFSAFHVALTAGRLGVRKKLAGDTDRPDDPKWSGYTVIQYIQSCWLYKRG